MAMRVCGVVFVGILFVAVAAGAHAVQLPTPAEHLVTDLPNAPTVAFKNYAGYIPVTDDGHRQLFYWFAESQNNPSTDPVVVWLNGGPGCSSLGGLFTENGPFWPTIHEELGLESNPYSWNTVANVIYIESPAGVGFSYSTDPSDYTVGDVRTANDSYVFLQNFFQMYPQFKTNEFWVSGESYGGHYVPELTARIVRGNEDSPVVPINIQGLLAGNAWTFSVLDNQGAVFDWWSHAFISFDTYKGLLANCDFGTIGPLRNTEQIHGDSALCDQYQNEAMESFVHVNIYDLYAHMCTPNDTSIRNQAHMLLYHLAASDSAMSRFAQGMLDQHEARVRAKQAGTGVGGPHPAAPCIGERLQEYMNLPAVKKAIHADQALPYNWTDCSPRVNYNYTDLLASVVPTYEFLIAHNLKLLVYSGDVDGIVPVTGTRAWIQSMNLPVVEKWRAWLVADEQTGGFIERHKGLDFATVRGAGHMVPGTQPARALAMFERYISGQPL